MEGLKPPRALSFEGHVAENWRRWIQQFRLYLNATGRDKKSEEMQCSTVAGYAVEVHNTFMLNKAEQQKIDRQVSLNSTAQLTYVIELCKLAKSYEFAQLHDSMIKDQIVCETENLCL